MVQLTYKKTEAYKRNAILVRRGKMKKVLILGGTRFFGRKIADKLLSNGYHVTFATRGNNKVPYGKNVSHVILDRSDPSHEGWNQLSQTQWDVVLDNICFTKEDAKLIQEKLAGKVEYYLFTSTLSVYRGSKDGFSETDFDPWLFDIDLTKKVTYGEGKRQAEKVLFEDEAFPTAALRIPIVLDTDDYTQRLHYYIRHIMNEESFRLYRADARISFIKGSEVANVMIWMIENHKTGVYNASSNETIEVEELMQMIEKAVGKKAEIEYSSSDEDQSPFSLKEDSYLKVTRLEKEHYPVPGLISWLKPLIYDLTAQIRKEQTAS